MFKILTPPSVDFKTNGNLSNPIKRRLGSDPHSASVVFWLKFDGQNGGTSFIDSSPLGVTVSRVGTSPPILSYDQQKFGATSGYFAGGNGYLSANHANFALGTGTFTVECWIYRDYKILGNHGLFSIGSSNTNFTTTMLAINNAQGVLSILAGTTGDILLTSNWNHIALVREGTGTNQTKTYLNGLLIYTTTNTTDITNTYYNIGVYSNTTSGYNGYIGSFRVTKGVARYTAEFNHETDTYLDLI